MTERVLLSGIICAILFVGYGCKKSEPVDQDAGAKAVTEGPPSVPHFTDVLDASGITFRHHFLDTETGSRYQINPYDHGSGIYVADVNGDGLDDIYFLDFLGPNALYLNKGGFKFEDITARAGVAVDRALSVGGAFGDYDNDGDQDLYVTTYRGGNHLFRNRGDGTFEEVTGTAGVGYNGHSSAATWFDHDLDGDLDLYLCNIGKFTVDTISTEADFFYAGVSLPIGLAEAPDVLNPGERDILYRNNGDGTFTDVTKEAGINSAEWNGDITVSDIDLDGDPDFYVSNMFGANHLYRNRGDGTFEEITFAALKRTSWGGMGARFFDSNGDEYPDLYVVDMHSDMWVARDKPYEVQAAAKFDNPLGSFVKDGKVISSPEETLAKTVLFGNTFFENNGNGRFVEKSAEAGLEMWWPWGITVGDYNNDGWQDLFVASGMGFPYFYWPNHLFINNGEGVYSDATSKAGIEPPARGQVIKGAHIRGRPFTRSSRSAATADFDGDGDLDIAVNNFNHEPYLLSNDSPKGSYIQLKLRGGKANRDAVGARVKVTAGGRTWHRQVCGAGGYITQSSLLVHIGLGRTNKVDSVDVYWPGQTKPQTVRSPALNEVVEIVQE